MFNDRKHTARYWHTYGPREREQRSRDWRLTLIAWLDAILILAAAALAYAIFMG